MKTVKKTALAAIVVFSALALLLVTCQPELPEDGDNGIVEYTDVEYSRDGRSITLYLDGATVPVTRQQRVLNLELAKMAHDFFEVIFIAGTDNHVARASWEIGQNAGISGVRRATNYAFGGTPGNGVGNAVIMVGKKAGAGKTLLGVGDLFEVDKATGTTVATGSKSVTFRVSPVDTTRLGWYDHDDDPDTDDAFFGDDDTAIFRTGAGSTPYSTPTVTNTLGRRVPVRPSILFPFFQLPAPPATGTQTISAIYRIKGITSLVSAIKVYAPIEAQKKIASFILAGQTFDASSSYDLNTTIGPITGNGAADAAFVPEFNITFIQTPKSSGVFSWTFQVPVYAITKATANNGGPDYETWYIRPGFGTYQYLLDDGETAGGGVLMGSDMGDSDWLEIFTEGFGFNN